MTKTFFISDTHFHHFNIALEFENEDGTPARIDPRTGERFTSVEDMDEFMIERWNSVVGSKDRVYHLGDFSIPRRGLQVFHRLNGRICVILGNHDPWKKKDWEQFKNIDQVQGVRMFPKLGWVCTHFPIHPRQFEHADSRWTHNIHGHLHNAKVTIDDYRWATDGNPPLRLPDPRYFNVSVEQIEYTPIELEELKVRIDEVKEKFGL